MWPRPTPAAARLVFGFACIQFLLLKFLPGPIRKSPITPAGKQSCYKQNGVPAWAATHLILAPLVCAPGWIATTAIYDNFGSILSVCSISALLFCFFLWLRGPSSADGARTSNPAFDYFWGVDLYPRLLGVDLKQLANCRLGMMSWCIIIWSFAARQYAVHHAIASSMWVVLLLQTAYILKFFFWEGGYLSTLDMMHDHFGFYICWGVTTWLPAIYTSQALYLVNHPRPLGVVWTCGLLAFGLGSIYLNYAADCSGNGCVRRAEGPGSGGRSRK
jgi:7-dehydrocholesterol reductase